MRSRLRALLAVPVGRLEARLGLGARLAEQPVVAVEAVEHRLRDREGARVGERRRESRRRPHALALRRRTCRAAASCASTSSSVVRSSPRRASSWARWRASTSRKRRSCGVGVAPRLVHVDQVLDLGQLQAEPLAAQGERQARPVARRVDAVAAASAAARAGRSPRRSGSRASSGRTRARARRS